jgi:hypothetical protein
MAATQRPLALAAVLAPSADAETIEVNASYAFAVSRPGKVADLIEAAAANTG